MKEKSRILILLSWIHDILFFEGIYVLAAAIQNSEGPELAASLLNGLFLLFPVILSYIVVCRCRNLWIFLVFSFAVTWGMRTASGNLLTGLLTAFIFVFRLYVKLKQGEIRKKMKEMPGEAGAQEDAGNWEVPTLVDTPRIPYCLLLAAMYLGMLPFHRKGLLDLMLGLLAADLCVCLAYCYLERLDGFVKENIRIANLPASTMRKIGNGILLAGIAGLLLFMVPATVYHKEPLENLRFDPLDTDGQIIEFYEEAAEPDYLMEELLRLKSQAKEAPEWMKKISDLLYILTLAGIIYAVVKFIFKAIRKAMESFADDEEDEIIFLGKEDGGMTEKNRKLRQGRKEELRSPDRKIRRMYKKLIRRTLRERPSGNETPLELEYRAGLYEKCEEPGKEDMDRIHGLYEKARYGQDSCTQEEARQFGMYSKGIVGK